MGIYRTALDQLAALNVAGVSTHYSLEQTPDVVPRAALPALLILPLEHEKGFFTRESDALRLPAFSGGAHTAACTLTHLLLMKPHVSGAVRQHIGALIDAVDAYFLALGASPLLGGALLTPPDVRVETGVFHYGGTGYVGCAFRHRWQIRIVPS